MKSMVAMVCITALGIGKMLVDGDGSVLTACVAAIGTLAGVEIGRQVTKATTQ